MSKIATTIFACSKCDAQFPKWLGQCSTCGTWGTLVQSVAPSRAIGGARAMSNVGDIPTLDNIPNEVVAHLPTGNSEFDLALGGGITPSALLLIAGEPGIGKSTLILQIAAAIAATGDVLYISGEETAAQIRNRAERTGVATARIRVLATADGERAAATIRGLHPSLAIVDSVQTLALPNLPTDAGGITQIRTLTNLLLATAKETGVPIILIGHVTKDGGIAGPKTLEHLVDQVAVLEGDPSTDLRILRTTKNRYGPTDVVGVFTMSEHGLLPCADPAAAFLGPSRATPGTATTATTLGNRTLLVELQALVTRSSFGQPQRRVSGIDLNRLHVLLAVLTRHGGLPLAAADVHATTIGGFRLNDPAADLALAVAIASAQTDIAPPFDVAIGEIGLDGLIRPVRGLERRIQEAVRLGRTHIAVPPKAPIVRGAHLVEIPSIRDLTRHVSAQRSSSP
ncbi:MAG: DNA repair protein RadA [Candidatus Uhrbacteria bacterium]